MWVKCLFSVCKWLVQSGGSCPTYTVASAGLQNALRSVLGVHWKLVVLQKFGVRTQSQDLKEQISTGAIRVNKVSVAASI